MRPTDGQGIKVAAGHDRFLETRKVFGVMPFTIKVATRDTAGGLLVIEQANAYPGGPPRHVHHEQDEWFYAISGRYLIEVGSQLHQLDAGDSVFAPRGVPHGWALEGNEAGRLLIAFQPAGTMEAFFAATADLGGMPPHQQLAELFAAHAMEITGPPLRTE